MQLQCSIDNSILSLLCNVLWYPSPPVALTLPDHCTISCPSHMHDDAKTRYGTEEHFISLSKESIVVFVLQHIRKSSSSLPFSYLATSSALPVQARRGSRSKQQRPLMTPSSSRTCTLHFMYCLLSSLSFICSNQPPHIQIFLRP